MDKLKIGNIITEPQFKDAVHMAIVPVEAHTYLRPGDHVSVNSNGTKTSSSGENVGVVDPFLKKPVLKGQTFWLFVYPGSITSLRHEWTHPKFNKRDEPSAEQRAESEAWLREFCSQADCPGYERTIEKALDNGDSFDSDYLYFKDEDAHGEIPDEFWNHLEIVSGRKFHKNERAKYFTCSC